MQNHRNRWLITLSCLLTILLITGCFQAAGDDTQVTFVAQNSTFTPEPIFTPVPEIEETEEVFIFEEFEVTEEPFFFEETEEPFFIWEETETPEPTPEFIDVFVTATPTPEESFLQLEQEAEPTLDLFQEQNLEAPAMTSTALVLTATALYIAPTLTQEAIDRGFDTEIPQEQPQDQGGGTGGFAPPVVEPTPIPPQPEVPFTGGSCTHTVRAGDNLFRISLANNTDVHQLAAVNGIANINLIVVGQQITIPNCTSGGTGGAVPPVGGSTTYTVRQNDNLFRIALSYNTTVHAIAALNGISNINLIYIGQVLAIP